MDVKTFRLLVEEKKEIVSRIEEQMKPDVKAGRLSDRALECFNHAKLSLRGTEEKLMFINVSEQQFSDAMHWFWRAAWNLGEFMARKPEKKE